MTESGFSYESPGLFVALATVTMLMTNDFAIDEIDHFFGKVLCPNPRFVPDAVWR